MTGKFPKQQDSVSCESQLVFDTIAYDKFSLTQTKPVKVKPLTVDGALSGSFEVVSRLVVVSKGANPGHSPTITAGAVRMSLSRMRTGVRL